MRAAPPPVSTGEALAPGYRVIRHLSRGNRLDVYDVWSEERDCRCVAKTLRQDRGAEPAARRALIAEARQLRRLTHPHLVRAYELTETLRSPRPVAILETLGGETLEHLLDGMKVRGRRVPIADAVLLGTQLSSVVGYLHRHGLVHLDLKPGNVIVEAGRAKLIDLSIARPPGRIRAGRGTPDYMSPEQASGGPVGAAADVWGLGTVLFEVLTLRRPFEEHDRPIGPVPTSTTATASSEPYGHRGPYPQLSHRAPPVASLRRMPRGLAYLVDASLRPDPSARPALEEVAERLRAQQASSGSPSEIDA
jgi:eukaryotic-like serine/threonine-protein kinase